MIAATWIASARSKASRERLLRSAAAAQSGPLKDTSAEVQVSLPQFHRLDENYTRGSEPASGGMKTLGRLGIKAVVDLRSVYDHTDAVARAAEVAGLRYYWMPMSVWNAPTDKEARDFVALVTDRSKGPFYVFCADGVNRTGEMSALYRLTNDNWNIHQTLKEMTDLGFNPYYTTLREYVWTYARKYRPNSLPETARRLSPFETPGEKDRAPKGEGGR
ncbi:MAG TPA: hypothetical protein VJQ56_06470 [Blastocatellia bacterium]|nr:hypothetical protein [Blastocatellia bacterium]